MIVPYSDPERRRAAKREQGPPPALPTRAPVGPPRPGASVATPTPAAVAPPSVGPGVGSDSTTATRSAGLLAVLLSELQLVRSFRADPLARGRVVAQLVSVALTASRSADLEAEVSDLERTVARLHAERDHNRHPRRLA